MQEAALQDKVTLRVEALRRWVGEFGEARVQEAAGYTNRRTLRMYLSQNRPPSWRVYHTLRKQFDA